jgi:hypothetical protein
MAKTPKVTISIEAQGPMLDIVVHCTTEAQVIKKLKELKNLVNPPRTKVVQSYRERWTTKKRTYYVDHSVGKIQGKHTFTIIHNHPQHPTNKL